MTRYRICNNKYNSNKIKNSGAKIVDFSDNNCWDDICGLFIPNRCSV